MNTKSKNESKPTVGWKMDDIELKILMKEVMIRQSKILRKNDLLLK